MCVWEGRVFDRSVCVRMGGEGVTDRSVCVRMGGRGVEEGVSFKYSFEF